MYLDLYLCFVSGCMEFLAHQTMLEGQVNIQGGYDYAKRR